jgi:four helix bundle suffix protein
MAAGIPSLMRFKAKRCATLEQVRAWVKEERARTITDGHGQARTNSSVPRSGKVRERPCVPSSPELVANAALSLLNLACHLLDRQIAAQEKASIEQGGFTERLYRVRSQRKNQSRFP